jgi:cytochrome c-type biogenesis protein
MIDLAAQFQTLSAASIAAFLLVAAAGLLMGVAPSSLTMYSVVVGSVAARSGRPTGPRRALLFALGFAPGVAAADALLGRNLGLVNLLFGLVLGAIGLAMLRVIRVPWLRRPDRYGWARR